MMRWHDIRAPRTMLRYHDVAGVFPIAEAPMSPPGQRVSPWLQSNLPGRQAAPQIDSRRYRNETIRYRHA